jgi:hypothetical protein
VALQNGVSSGLDLHWTKHFYVPFFHLKHWQVGLLVLAVVCLQRLVASYVAIGQQGMHFWAAVCFAFWHQVPGCTQQYSGTTAHFWAQLWVLRCLEVLAQNCWQKRL